MGDDLVVNCWSLVKGGLLFMVDGSVSLGVTHMSWHSEINVTNWSSMGNHSQLGIISLYKKS